MAGSTAGGGGPGGEARLSARGALSHIPRPVLTVWQPARATGHGVLVAAGGGYQRIEMGSEAWPAAHWLTAHGYTAYVLSYRLPGEGWQAGALAPLQDAQRALRLIRARESQVSVLGFSAGDICWGWPPVGRRLPATRRRMRWTTSPPPPTAPR